MDKLNPPQELSEHWKLWKQELMLYITATEKTKKSDEVKSSILLTCIGPRGREVYNTFGFDDDSMKMNFNYILQQFDDYCSPQKNVTFLRYKFFSYRESEGQCFDNFVTELKKLSKECEFSDLQNSLIRDMIVIGITDNYLRQRLLREPDLTLDSAIKLGYAYEETKNHVLELLRDFTQNPEIDKISKLRKPYRFWKRNPNPDVIMK